MKTNRAGVDLIKRWESLRREAYVCPAGAVTIGYGSTGPHVHLGMRITEQQAEELLARDLERFEVGVARLTAGVTLTENQFSSLVSLAFNVGLGDPKIPHSGGFANSTLLRKLRAGDHAGAAEEFPKWNKAGGKVLAGLVSRRADERALFLRAA